MNVIASLVARPEGPADPGPGYYARPTGATLAAHGLPTGIQRRRSDGRFRAVIGHRHTRTFATVEEALAWRRTALAVLAIPMHYPSDDPATEAVRRAVLRGGLAAVGL